MRAELPATLEILDCINKEGEEIDSDGEASEPEGKFNTKIKIKKLFEFVLDA